MSNQIDDLFKKKLEVHSVEPDPNVWSRISSGLLKKNKAIIWFRAAAALLLMVSAFWLYQNISNSTPSKITEVQPTELKEEKPAVIQEKAIEEKHNTIKASVPTIQKPELLADKKSNKSHNKMVEEDNPAINMPINNIPIKQAESIAQVDTDPMKGNTENEEAVSKPTSKPIVIVYELKSYTVKTESDSEFDPFLQKKNGLKKVLDVANNIRTGESPLGGLRQVKEELFALNFKKEDKHNK